jgi:arabinan endo-1,5-alpha-L-arabinosidase
MVRRLLLLALVTGGLTVCGVMIGGLASGATTARAADAIPPASPLPTTTPLINARTRRPLSCPDPSVVHAARPRFTYFLYCTSDAAAGALPIYGSRNLVDWYPLGSVFAPGHEPPFVLPTSGSGPHGRFWGPSINFIDGHWVLYFSAEYNPASHAAASDPPAPGTMVLGVATSRALGGPWTASLLHYPGELNAANPTGDHELGGGDIDPAAVIDPATGQRLLVWAQQRDRIWMSGLSADGLALGPAQQLAFGHSEPWECDPANHVCTVEGPQPLFHDGRLFVLYSAASTWDGSYAVGVASAPAPFAPFTKDPEPILRSGNGILGPGGVSDPTTAPDGQTVVLYHALRALDPTHASGQRLLMLGTLSWTAAGQPLIDDGTA